MKNCLFKRMFIYHGCRMVIDEGDSGSFGNELVKDTFYDLSTD